MKKVILITVLSFAIAAGALFGSKYVLAEQSGSSPDSGATSYIKATYDSIVALGHGSVAAGAWGDWGAYWNRIRSAAEWVPSSNATVADVKSGRTFNNTSRTQATGTYPNPTSCSTQQYHDSYGAPVTQTTNCTDTLTWTAASPAVTGDDASGNGNQDPRTGLIWSKYLQNSAGTVVFADAAGSTWNWDGTDNAQGVNNKAVNGGVAPGKTATELCSERGNGWRLPSQKELMQVYIDGSYFKLSNPSNYFWSITENSGTAAWNVTLTTGATNYTNKATAAYYVRCVR